MTKMSANQLADNVLGVYGDTEIVYLFSKDSSAKSDILTAEVSTDGEKFTKFKGNIKIVDVKRKPVITKNISHLNVSRVYDNYFLSYRLSSGGKSAVYGAIGKDFNYFKGVSPITGVLENAVLVPNYKFEGKYVLFFGGPSIKAVTSEDLKNWTLIEEPIVKSYDDFYGKNILEVGGAFVTESGILLIFFVTNSNKKLNQFEIKAALIDRGNPFKAAKLIEDKIWEMPKDWVDKNVLPLGIAKLGDNYVSFWKSKDGIYSVFHPSFLFELPKRQFPYIILHKLKQNPILKPIIENFWESKATFNPTAILAEGKVHIVYRAIGDDDVSVLGYASSSDGENIDLRLANPIYVPREPFESSSPYSKRGGFGKYVSGGGCFGGCEDPRLTKIGDKIYMTYVAYNGWEPPRVAMTSIDYRDFINHNFKWGKPVLISEPGVVNKNACLFPEMINGKYVMLHRVFPDILIDFLDELNFEDEIYLKGEYKIKPIENYWDSLKVGAGPSPVKTEKGWLLIYQAVGNDDPGRYKIGAMLLDSNDPTKVIARSLEPIISPDEWYENEGHKSGVVYPCGAVILNEKLIVYYGGADTVVCAASAPIDEFLANLEGHKSPKLSPSLISN